MEFMKAHFRSNTYTWQASKVDGCNCAWCSQPSKNLEQAIKLKGFVPPPSYDVETGVFTCRPVLEKEIDMDEIYCPSKIKKNGKNPNTNGVKRKNNLRCKIRCQLCYKWRPIYALKQLNKDQREDLREYISLYNYQCGYPLYPENNIEFTTLNFGNNTVETNHNVTCNDLIDIHMDYKFPSCVYCGNENLDLDLGNKFRPMCKECLKTKTKTKIGVNNTKHEDKINEAISKIQKRKRQQTIDFPIMPKLLSSEKNIKVKNENNKRIKKAVINNSTCTMSDPIMNNIDNKDVVTKVTISEEIKCLGPGPKDKNAYLDEDESEEIYMERLTSALKILGLEKYDVSGMGDCQLLAICLAYFGKKNYDESDNKKHIINMKWMMINKYENEAKRDDLEYRCLHWRKHVIGDCLPTSLYMNDYTIEYISTILEQIICVFYKPTREKHFIGQIFMPGEDLNSLKRSALFFIDGRFYYNPDKNKVNNRVICPIDEWLNDGSITFMWHKGLHYQACCSKTDRQFYSSRMYESLEEKYDWKSVWKHEINSTCPVCAKQWANYSVWCDLCGGCVHYDCIGQDFYEKHKTPKCFEKRTFVCYNCMDNIKEKLESYKKELDINRSLRLIESVNWFFSYLVIAFTAENVDLFKKILQYKQVDRRITAVR